MRKENYSDTEILLGLKENNAPVIRYVYIEMFQVIRNFIVNNSGSENDAEDIFQDTLVILYTKITREKFVLSSSLKTFLFSVSRNLWLQRLELRKRCMAAKSAEAESYQDNETLDAELMHMEKINLLQKYLLAMDKECQRLLRLFLQKLSLKEITEMLGFSSPDYTKFRKYQCKNRLKKQIMEDPYCKMILTYA
jgi:RNA polymerase sigma factor (sigma-70 family)